MEYIYDSDFGTLGIEEYEEMDNFIDLAREVGWRLPSLNEFVDGRLVDPEFNEVWPYVFEHGCIVSYMKTDGDVYIVLTIQWTSDASAGTEVEIPCYIGEVQILYPDTDHVSHWSDVFISDVACVYVPEKRGGEWLGFEIEAYEQKTWELLEQVFAGTGLI